MPETKLTCPHCHKEYDEAMEFRKCNECGEEVEEVHAGDEGLSVCTGCAAIEAGDKTIYSCPNCEKELP